MADDERVKHIPHAFGREKLRENDISLTKTKADATTFDQRISILGFRPYIQVL